MSCLGTWNIPQCNSLPKWSDELLAALLLLLSYYMCVPVTPVVSDSLQPSGCGPPGSCLWDSPGKNNGVVSSSRGSSWPRSWIHVSYIPCIGKRVLHHYCHQSSSPTGGSLAGYSLWGHASRTRLNVWACLLLKRTWANHFTFGGPSVLITWEKTSPYSSPPA